MLTSIQKISFSTHSLRRRVTINSINELRRLEKLCVPSKYSLDSEQDSRDLCLYGYTGVPTKFLSYLTPNVYDNREIASRSPYSSLSQLGEGIYTVTGYKEVLLASKFGIRSSLHEESDCSVLAVWGPAFLDGKVIPELDNNNQRLWFGELKNWEDAYPPFNEFMQYDFLYSQIENMTSYSQVKFNPKSFSFLKTKECVRISRHSSLFKEFPYNFINAYI